MGVSSKTNASSVQRAQYKTLAPSHGSFQIGMFSAGALSFQHCVRPFVSEKYQVQRPMQQILLVCTPETYCSSPGYTAAKHASKASLRSELFILVTTRQKRRLNFWIISQGREPRARLHLDLYCNFKIKTQPRILPMVWTLVHTSKGGVLLAR